MGWRPAFSGSVCVCARYCSPWSRGPGSDQWRPGYLNEPFVSVQSASREQGGGRSREREEGGDTHTQNYP